jgi:hypothetical protein
METEERKLKEELLDSIVVDPSGGVVHEIDLEVLKNHEDPNTVISAFCSNCGSYHELGFLAAEKVLMNLNQSIEFENKYFLFHSCSLCKGDDLTVELKNF